MSEQFESFEEIHRVAETTVGVRLFTVSVLADTGTGMGMARVYTSHPAVYPVGGMKTFAGDTSPIWLEQVIDRQQPFLGPDRGAVRTFFFDYETIESLGCGAIVNVPVVSNGSTIGSMNFLDSEGKYDQNSVDAAREVAQRSTKVLENALAKLPK